MIAACFLPHPPLLLEEYASLADPGADLRAGCHDLLVEVAALRPARVAVVTGADRVPAAISTRAALGLRVARELLSGVGLPMSTVIEIPFDADADEIAAAGDDLRAAASGPCAVLVMGDGSARRGEKAPGHLDDRAFEVDKSISDGLAAGNPAPLAELDPELAAELLIAGRAAWQVFAAAAPGPPSRVTASAVDPFGVLYHRALWSWAP